MFSDLLVFFTDPVLRAPTIGSMLMCLASSLVGVIVFIRRRSLLGEALSHASYPGVVLSVIFAASLFPYSDDAFAICILIGAFIFAMLGLWVINKLELLFKVKSDAALCFVLSTFFGLGILIASRIQVTHALWYKQIQLFLYGQAATMTDIHIGIYGTLALIIILFIIFLYRQIQVANFDPDFAKSSGLKVRWIDNFVFFLLGLAIVVGIRSVGVVLMSGMLIAPAVAARQFTHRLSYLFIMAAVFGVVSAFFGNYFSITVPQYFSEPSLRAKFSLPTGPMILLCAAFFCFVSLLFAPSRGLLSRYFRIARFRNQCMIENTLKAFWRRGAKAEVEYKEMTSWQALSRPAWRFLLLRLLMQGYIEKVKKGCYRLTEKGERVAARIVRIHRLWEVYLVYLGQGVEKVHRNAEEMEHIITPELEKELTELLKNPKVDPHHQPIPAKHESH